MEMESANRQYAIDQMTNALWAVLKDNMPSVYLYGSVVLDDFRPGWSDIDLLVLCRQPIAEAQAKQLVCLRQTMPESEPGNPYYRSFEGGMLTIKAFLTGEKDRVVYWGTSGERITDRYLFDSFSRMELLEKGRLLCGQDVRGRMVLPGYEELYADVKQHFESIRIHARQTDESLYSFGWMLDIARSLFTLRTGKIISKTAAGNWALKEHLCPVPEALELALEVRCAPRRFIEEPEIRRAAHTMGGPIQRFADVLERELGQYNPKQR